MKQMMEEYGSLVLGLIGAVAVIAAAAETYLSGHGAVYLLMERFISYVF